MRDLELRLEAKLESKLDRLMREQTVRRTSWLIAAPATMTTLNLTAVALLR